MGQVKVSLALADDLKTQIKNVQTQFATYDDAFMKLSNGKAVVEKMKNSQAASQLQSTLDKTELAGKELGVDITQWSDFKLAMKVVQDWKDLQKAISNFSIK